MRRANAIRRFHPSVVSYQGEIYWLAGVAVKRQRSASSPSQRIAPPYALVLGYMAALVGGAPDAAIAG
jgi:hypothetical protein